MSLDLPAPAAPDDPFEGLRAVAALPFDRARSMPPAVYTSPAFHEAEQREIFARDWICVGRAGRLARAGDYLTAEIAGQPIIVLRDGEGAIRAMSNVCLHRMSVLLEGAGNTRSIVCPYHAWTYNLDGSLRGAPIMSDNRDFCRDQRLPQVRAEEWQGWIMVTLNPEAPPVAERLARLEPMIAPFGLAEYTELFHETHRWDTNWKVLCENFMESYHLPACHAGTIGGVTEIDGHFFTEDEEAFNLHYLTKDPSFVLANAHPANTRLTGEWRGRTAIVAVYPSLLITATPGYFWYLSLLPHGVGQVDITFGGGLAPDFIGAPEAQESFAKLHALLTEVNKEDRGCTERVFRGLNAPLAKAGHLSRLERPLYDFAQFLAARLAPGPAAG
ncbi:aromatic ring-hydroxylating dioxygenase subunit alpha [Oceanicella sp. SM1341]|uniref:aromatic ring-hydroxylating oxygenase subunit alpha n=1 Tax=Oceanicella sp. SM1341 TaxID=1548889 RepID=UPI000E4D4FFB|nr:SRPBCC family protein [Oceanicella sp. SM1341]